MPTAPWAQRGLWVRPTDRTRTFPTGSLAHLLAAAPVTCVLFTLSFHMADLAVEGRDAVTLLSHLAINTFKNLSPERAKQFVPCSHDGRRPHDHRRQQRSAGSGAARDLRQAVREDAGRPEGVNATSHSSLEKLLDDRKH